MIRSHIAVASLLTLPIAGVCTPPAAVLQLMNQAGVNSLPMVAPPNGQPAALRGFDAARFLQLRFVRPQQSQAPAAVAASKLTFDEPSAAAGPVSAPEYLARYGITIKDMTPGTEIQILNATTGVELYGGQAAKAVSGDNVLTQRGSIEPIGFTLAFAAPLRSLRFSRAGLIAATPSGITHPAWLARAYDSSGRLVAVASEGLIAEYKDVPPAAFVLSGPSGIASVRFDSDGKHFAAFGAVLLDDIELQ